MSATNSNPTLRSAACLDQGVRKYETPFMKSHSTLRALAKNKQMECSTDDSRSLKVYCVPNFALMLQRTDPAQQAGSAQEFLSYFNKSESSQLLSKLSQSIEQDKL